MKTGSLITMLFPVLAMYGQSGKLVWEEKFNSNKIDTTFWNFETGTGVNGDWGTGQLDRATDRKQNVSIKKNVKGADSSCLVITTRAEEFMDRKYTSGRINTKGKASWGSGHRIVARVYAQDVKSMGQGFAFWMLADEKPPGKEYMMWPQGGEIDIMEYVGSIPFHNLGSVHYAWSYENNEWQSWNHTHQGFYYSFKDQQVPKPSEPGYGNYPPSKKDTLAGSWAFHEYGINWYADRIEFFVDSTVYHVHYLNDGGGAIFAKDGENEDSIEDLNGKRTGLSEYSNHFLEWHPYEHKMYIILSAGVGGSKNTYGGPIDGAAKFPCSVFVDWVRVYEL